MTSGIPLLLCGEGFGPQHVQALAHSGFQPVGVLADDAHGDRDAAADPLPRWHHTSEAFAALRAAWVWPTGCAENTVARACNLLTRGIAVLLEPGLPVDALAACVRVARGSGAVLHVAAPSMRIPATQRFLAVARKLRDACPVCCIVGEAGRNALPLFADLACRSLGGLRDCALDDHSMPGSGYSLLTGRLTGVPLSLRLREEAVEPVSWEDWASLSLTLDCGSGRLTLVAADGIVTWTPSRNVAVTLGGPEFPTSIQVQWQDAMRGELSWFAQTLSQRQTLLGPLQQAVQASQLSQRAQALLSDTKVRQSVPAVDVAQLALVAIQTDAPSPAEVATLPSAPVLDADAREHLFGITNESGTDPADAAGAAMRRLDALCAHALSRFLAEASGWRTSRRACTADDVAAALEAAPRHAWLVRRWLVTLQERGLLDCRNGRYRWCERHADEAVPAGATLAEAYAALGFPAVMATVHAHALDRLDALITDQTSIQQILFARGDMLETLAAYQDNLFSTYLNRVAARLLWRAYDAGSAPLRVLELGTGCGLTTTAVLRELVGCPIDYLCTDLSSLFTLAARKRYADTPGMRYANLDIDRDFAGQGVASGSVDVVLAGNVLHNAFHTRRSLYHIRRVLRRGGWLVFTESTHETLALLTCMQFLLSAPPGEARIHNDDPRMPTGRVFLDVQEWQVELAASGFRPRFSLPGGNDPLATAGQRLFFAIAD